MASDAWHAARDRLSAGRTRCLERIAARLGREVASLPLDIIHAVRDYGTEAFNVGQQYAHEMETIRPRPSSTEYSSRSEEVTRVERPPRR